MAIAGVAAWYIRSSAAYMYVVTASVSKLKGLNIKVAGSSFTTSEVTNNTEVKKLAFIKGKWILPKSVHPEEPSRRAELSMEMLILL